MKKICFITGSRAEYGLLKKLIFLTKKEKNLTLQLIVSCMHLSSKFGNNPVQYNKQGRKRCNRRVFPRKRREGPIVN